MEDYERVLLVKSDVFIYKIPPKTTNRAHRAADWKLDAPDWTGRLRLVAKGKECILKLEDKMSGELFGKSPIDKYPGVAVEAVSDSSRYFVIRLQDDNGRNAFIGIGFSDRGDSFDLNVALQDHFKALEIEEKIEKEPEDSQPKLDLGFKEGQTIKVNLNIKKSGSNSSSNRPRVKSAATALGSGGILLPPPPGAAKGGPTKSSPNTTTSTSTAKANPVTNNTKQENDLLLDINALSIGSINTTESTTNTNINNNDLFGDFESITTTSNKSNVNTTSWDQFS
ncbi:NECAP-like protein CG9132 [Oppia nitens]|uniref:NECAP-like protein CG9132 n=1 Tax=Oppia nitens TaxID=1686743 RepID=UPI0023DB23CB|nr:NECAP-like protein CG9132 [Oppia nitens]